MQHPNSSNQLSGAAFGVANSQHRFGPQGQVPHPHQPASPPPLGIGYGLPGANLSPHAVPVPSPRAAYANPNAFNSILDSWQGPSRAAPQAQGQFGMQPQGLPPSVGYGSPYSQCKSALD